VGAYLGAEATTLAMLQIESHHLALFDQDGRIRAIEPTHEIMSTYLRMKNWPEGPPAPGIVLFRVTGLEDQAPDGELLPALESALAHSPFTSS
jgi:hypothetical protein